jgi:hypothetical protein
VNKIQISRVTLIESPCCDAPSTTLAPVSASTVRNRDGRRRCVRCRQPFCRIDVDDRRTPPLKVVVGAQAE